MPKYIPTKSSASSFDEEIQPTGSPVVTARPVFIAEDDLVVDQSELLDAVILKAKWERLSRATPRKVRIQRKTTRPVEPVDS